MPNNRGIVEPEEAADLLGLTSTEALILQPRGGWSTQTIRSFRAKRPRWAYSRAGIEREVAFRLAKANLANADHSPDFPQEINHKGSIELHIGPTNSGKTYGALERLWDADTGVYATPLRALAHEVFIEAQSRLGECVGLMTGEMKINPDAPIIIATTEAAPRKGNLLVLDEAHWLNSPNRGWAWVELLTKGSFSHIIVLGDSSCVNPISSIMQQAEMFERIEHARLGNLVWGGELEMQQLPRRSALVFFSVDEVISGAQVLSGLGYTTAVLYGRMPVKARQAQLEKFCSGRADILVCTDVIGHGVNLPIDNVILGGVHKYDGNQRRHLELWELAQLIGRAGRGAGKQGSVYCLSGITKESATKIKEDALKIALGRLERSPMATVLYKRPSYQDLTLGYDVDVRRLYDLLDAWVKKHSVAGDGLWRSSNLENVRTRLGLCMMPYKGLGRLGARVAWELASAPVTNDCVVEAFAWACVGNMDPIRCLQGRSRKLAEGDLAAVELVHSLIRDFRVLKHRCDVALPDTLISDAELEAMDSRYQDELNAMLL